MFHNSRHAIADSKKSLLLFLKGPHIANKLKNSLWITLQYKFVDISFKGPFRSRVPMPYLRFCYQAGKHRFIFTAI